MRHWLWVISIRPLRFRRLLERLPTYQLLNAPGLQPPLRPAPKDTCQLFDCRELICTFRPFSGRFKRKKRSAPYLHLTPSPTKQRYVVITFRYFMPLYLSIGRLFIYSISTFEAWLVGQMKQLQRLQKDETGSLKLHENTVSALPVITGCGRQDVETLSHPPQLHLLSRSFLWETTEALACQRLSVLTHHLPLWMPPNPSTCSGLELCLYQQGDFERIKGSCSFLQGWDLHEVLCGRMEAWARLPLQRFLLSACLCSCLGSQVSITQSICVLRQLEKHYSNLVTKDST